MLSLRIVPFVLVALAVPARGDDAVWRFHVAWGNDAFSDVAPPIDDDGFTADFAASIERVIGRDAIGVAVASRWLTSTRDLRRWDQLDILLTAARTWPHHLTAVLRGGPCLAGNLGGRYWQDRLHRTIGAGRTLDTGLQNDYDGENRIGGIVGLRGSGEIGERWGAYAAIDGQVAFGGTGITSVAGVMGGRLQSEHLGAHVELALTRYHVGDPNLALPGGYGSGWQLEWRVGVYGAWRRYRLEYEYRANDSGSGQPIGVLALDGSW